MANENTSITSNKFICEKCYFKCSKKGDYNRHLLTDKHERLTMANKITSQNDNIFKCECSKEFKHSSSLSKHKKKCFKNGKKRFGNFFGIGHFKNVHF